MGLTCMSRTTVVIIMPELFISQKAEKQKARNIVAGFSKEKFSNVLLSHGNSHTTIGATAFHF